MNWPFKVWTSNSLEINIVYEHTFVVFKSLFWSDDHSAFHTIKGHILYIHMQITVSCGYIEQPEATWVGITAREHCTPRSLLISLQSKQQRIALLLWLHIKTWLALSNPQLMVSGQQIKVQSGCLILIHLMHLQAIFSEALLGNYDAFVIIHRGL